MAVATSVQVFRGIVTLSADGGTIARIREKDFKKLPLAQGDVFDEEEYLDRMAALQMTEACNMAIGLLAAGEKTKADLRRTLLRRGIVPSAADAAVARAAEHRFVDDARYAKRVAELASHTNAGVYAVQRKLRAKGVSQEDTEEALSTLDDEQQAAACTATLAKIAHRYSDLPRREARAKASQALARRGFSWEQIRNAIDAWMDEWEEDWEDD